jgi:hypothetical protein
MLSPGEVAAAKQGARDLMLESARRGCRPKYGYTGDPLLIDEVGTAGAMAACKILGWPWSPAINTFKGPDAGTDIQLRTAPCRKQFPPDAFGRLILHPEDNPAHRYVLVVGQVPYFRVAGWCWGYERQRLGLWLTYRAPAWYVPWWRLHLNLSPLCAPGLELERAAESATP